MIAFQHPHKAVQWCLAVQVGNRSTSLALKDCPVLHGITRVVLQYASASRATLICHARISGSMLFEICPP